MKIFANCFFAMLIFTIFSYSEIIQEGTDYFYSDGKNKILISSEIESKDNILELAASKKLIYLTKEDDKFKPVMFNTSDGKRESLPDFDTRWGLKSLAMIDDDIIQFITEYDRPFKLDQIILISIKNKKILIEEFGLAFNLSPDKKHIAYIVPPPRRGEIKSSYFMLIDLNKLNKKPHKMKYCAQELETPAHFKNNLLWHKDSLYFMYEDNKQTIIKQVDLRNYKKSKQSKALQYHFTSDVEMAIDNKDIIIQDGSRTDKVPITSFK